MAGTFKTIRIQEDTYQRLSAMCKKYEPAKLSFDKVIRILLESYKEA